MALRFGPSGFELVGLGSGCVCGNVVGTRYVRVLSGTPVCYYVTTNVALGFVFHHLSFEFEVRLRSFGKTFGVVVGCGLG
jgi:hypothetical protein